MVINSGNKQEWSYKASSCSLRSIRDDFKQYLNINHVDDVTTGYIIIAINEICMNIIQHADDGNYSGNIIIRAEILDNILSICVEDEAAAVEAGSLKGRDIDKLEPGGLGLYLVNDIMDTIVYSDRSLKAGNCLIMTKRLENSDEI